MTHSLRTLLLLLITALAQVAGVAGAIAAGVALEYGGHGRGGRMLFFCLAAGAGVFAAAIVVRRRGDEASAWSMLTLALAVVGIAGGALQGGTYGMASMTGLLFLPVGLVATADLSEDNDLQAGLLRFMASAGAGLILALTTYSALHAH